jgi:hypothetical protein
VSYDVSCNGQSRHLQAKFAVFRFLDAKNMSAVKIHHELCKVYSQNVMNE